MMTSNSSVEFWSHPQMPYVETRRACQSRTCYKSHSHPTFSIGAVDVGKSYFSSYFSQNQEIQSGYLVVIPAHVEHSCNPLPDQAWSYHMMHLDAVWLAKLMSEIDQDVQTHHLINDTIVQLKPDIINDAQIYQSFINLNALLFNPNISIFLKEQYLIQILTDILLPNFKWELVQFSDYYQSYLPQFKKMLSQGIEHLSLLELAEQLQMSRYSVIRLFKHYLGLTPHAYQLNHKINQARIKLKEEGEISQLAYELAFVDQSHFQKIFKQYTGVTPKQYRNQS